MAKPEENDATKNRSPAQEALGKLWEDHVRYEFSTRNTDDTLATMVEDAYVNPIPVMTSGAGKTALREFYSRDFIPSMPPDTTLTPISRTVGEDQTRRRDDFLCHPHAGDALDAAWRCPDVSPCRSRIGGSCALSRW